jgi:DNA helicase-2/ATP-dependent DNA helicase PcrA
MSNSEIPEEAARMLEEEGAVVRTVIDSLLSQREHGLRRLSTESSRARTLTAEYVAARRVEDKAMLASDEAVAHGLTHNKEAELKSIEKLLKKPYFARIVFEELEDDGSTREIEYKLGFAANTECRIIDWRKAPIAKLYYEYKEGDEFSEQILGRERIGRIKLRNTVEIEDGGLKRLVCRFGQFEQRGESGWVALSEPARSRAAAGAGELPHILSLITPEQFRTITEDARTAILIQGIAGSGKTTVALHRLAWLLHEENTDLKADECVVIVRSKALKAYVSRTLPSIEIHGVRVLTFHEWSEETTVRAAPALRGAHGIARPPEGPGHAIERLKRSFAWLAAVEKTGVSMRGALEDRAVELLKYPREVLENDDTKLLNEKLVSEAHARAATVRAAGELDWCDDATIVRLFQLAEGGVALKDGNVGRYRHIVVDEVQDFSPTELAVIIGAVSDTRNLTLVGDTAQKIEATSPFPGWDRLRERWAFKDSMSKYLSLTVSFRSTLPIMKLADYVQKRPATTHGRNGRIPIWFKCRRESRGVESVIEWLKKAGERYPLAATAVICRDPKEARYALSLLDPTFGAAARIGDEESFSFDAGIIVTDVRQVKGLEFTNVLLWNPSAKSYPKDDLQKNALYVAITRAEENLALVTWGKPSEHLPSIFSPLVRGIENEPEEV